MFFPKSITMVFQPPSNKRLFKVGGVLQRRHLALPRHVTYFKSELQENKSIQNFNVWVRNLPSAKRT